MEITIKPIGIIQSCYVDRFGTPRQPGLVKSSRAFLKIFPEFQPEQSLQGLGDFSHLWVIFGFHKNTNERFHAKIHPPRLEGKTIGLFATRAPHRPNPLGLSVCKIEEVQIDGLWLSGVDVIDGTPVFDIKPYHPEVESISDAKKGWIDSVVPKDFVVSFTQEQEKQITNWEIQNNVTGLKNLISETLSLDPRPTVYKGYEGQESPYRQSHVVRLYNVDVFYRFESPTKMVIEKIIDLF